MRNNDTQHVVKLSRPLPGRVVLGERLPIPNNEDGAMGEFSSFAVSRGWLGKFATLLLLPMIFIYPLAPAYAAEEASSTTSTTDVTASTTDAGANPPASPDSSLSTDLSSAISGVATVVTGLFSSDTASTSTATSTDAITSGTTTTSDEGTSTISIGGDTATDTASTTETTTDASSTPADASSTPEQSMGSSDGTITEATSTLTASSTDELASATTTEVVTPAKTPQEIAQEMLSAQEDSMRASIRKEVEDEFTKGCVSLDTTGYYCLKDKPSSGGALTPSAVVTDVTSAPDAAGVYKQIFMTKGGVTTQLTHFDWDSAFPTIDISGKSIVWQGNVSGRWQIFYANSATSGDPEIVQLTHSNESNFNPKVDGDDVVWQGWVDGNWEIFLAEHLTPDAYFSSSTLPVVNKLLAIDNTWRVTRITTNSVHDMFPAVAGGLVTWQSFQDNAWNVYVYSIKTGGTQKISSSGEKSEKPRFAITWDERTPQGDARMIGYDIATGKTIDITNEARQVNDQKPYSPPPTPVSQPDQAALPITNVGTSTTAKSEGDASSTPNGLDI